MRFLPPLFDSKEYKSNNIGMLNALNGKARTRGEIFQGADAKKRETNRRRNKAARKARRAHRG